MVAVATRSWRIAMDVTVLQSFLPAGIAQPVRILRLSGKMGTATLPPMLRRKLRSRMPRSIHSRRPRERVDKLGYELFVTGHWSLVMKIADHNHVTNGQ